MNVHLTPELEQIILTKVKTGRYNSASEVVREALRLMEERDLAKAEIRKEILAGLASSKAGRLSDGDAFFDQMEAELDHALKLEDVRAESNGDARP